MATHAITDLAIVLKPHDDVAIAKREIAAGTVLEDADGRIEARQDIRPGHKIARRAVRTGDAVRRYGQIIGFATAEIAAGITCTRRTWPSATCARTTSSAPTCNRSTTTPPHACAISTGTSARTAGSGRATTWRSSPASTARRA